MKQVQESPSSPTKHMVHRKKVSNINSHQRRKCNRRRPRRTCTKKIQFEPQLQVQHPHHHNHHNHHEEQQDSQHHASSNHAAKTSSSLFDPMQPGIGSGFLKEHREPVDSVGVDGEDLETIISVHGDRSSFDMFRKEVEAAAML
mmetsp:Transcript_33397/g.60338  ORF Transcript_33397/g.60338 Transcript_33397/m.60338 type:complete len:144 (+) Transcript_33397:601-1032(+)